ncbi:hypothetical protein [Streptomyces sp. NBC_01304]|uniref:hypothetical protein n=1 Tax=Streptomyces sp. NBC_01304 TaxID=2903818 RepID=UPI002E0F4C86|nr:hypothetical protein OG430_23275 [Streptomyces sp. NBC_01304]
MAYVLALWWITGVPFMTWKVVQLWRNADRVEFFMLAFTCLPFGKEVRRGRVRALGATVVTLWGAALLFFLGLYDVELTGAWPIVGLVAAVALLGGFACDLTVVLFNRPKWIVPPHMRSEAGVIAARRAVRAKEPRRRSHGQTRARRTER